MKRKTLIFAIIVYALGTVSDAQTLTDQQAIDQLKMLNQAYTAIAARVTESVVTVTTKRVEDIRAQGRPVPDFFHRFQFLEHRQLYLLNHHFQRHTLQRLSCP